MEKTNRAPKCTLTFVTVVLLGSGSAAQAQNYGNSLIAGNFTGSGNLNYSDSFVVGAPSDSAAAYSSGSASVFTLTNSGSNTFADHDLLQSYLNGSYFTGAADGGSAQYDQFGYTFATGDFDGDGLKDLAIGVPFESANGAFGVGCVHVLFGGPAGPLGMPFRQATAFLTRANVYPDVLPATPTGSDQFGAALAAGDFNGDGLADLAIGAPGVSVDGLASAGAVFLFYSSPGSAQDVFQTGNEWTMVQGGQWSPGGTAGAGNRFGSALAAGNFDGDFNATGSGTGPMGRPDLKDLAVSSPGQTVNSVYSAGAVTVYYGAVWNIRPALVISNPNPGSNDGFGSSLAAGDFNAYCGTLNPQTCSGLYDDLAVGVPHKTIGSASSAGEVLVYYGTAAGLNTATSIAPAPQTWTSANFSAFSPPSPPQANAMFGYSLATGDVLNNEENGGCQGQSCNPVELVIGEPFRNATTGPTFAGNVYVLHGGLQQQLDLNGGATVIRGNVSGAMSGYSVTVGRIANSSGQDGTLIFADILIGQPGINNVLMQMGGEGIITQQPAFQINFPFQYP